jgi:hypothetical protein
MLRSLMSSDRGSGQRECALDGPVEGGLLVLDVQLRLPLGSYRGKHTSILSAPKGGVIMIYGVWGVSGMVWCVCN